MDMLAGKRREPGRRSAGGCDLEKGVVRVSRMCSVRVCLWFLITGLVFLILALRTFSHAFSFRV